MPNNIVGFVFALLAVTLFACAPKPAPIAPEAAKAPGAIAEPEVKEGWEAEWDRVKKEAKKEGKLVLYSTAGSEARMALMKELKKYGITLESVPGSPSELVEKPLRERKAGIYNVDFLQGGLSMHLRLEDAEHLTPVEPLLILPEVKDPKMWYKGELPFAGEDKMTIGFGAYLDEGIHINTDMVKPGDIKSMYDLLSPRWKGKIIMYDPLVAGRGQKWMAIVALRFGEEYVRNLAKQDPFLTRDYKMLVDWLARGKYAVAIGARAYEYIAYKREGLPLANIVIEDIAYLEGGMHYLSHFVRAPNPSASRVFLNWFLSREGQIVWQKVNLVQSARIDIPVDYLDNVRKPGLDYHDVRYEKWEREVRVKGDKINMEVFRPLIR